MVYFIGKEFQFKLFSYKIVAVHRKAHAKSKAVGLTIGAGQKTSHRGRAHAKDCGWAHTKAKAVGLCV